MRRKTKKDAVLAREVAARMATDRRFRQRIAAAAGHGVRARAEARRTTRFAMVRRLAEDDALRRELARMVRDLQGAGARASAAKKKVERRRRNRIVRGLLLLGAAGAAAAAAVPQVRHRLGDRRTAHPRGGSGGTQPHTLAADLEVEVPLSVAYNQWTQFEEFPSFMEGVEEVHQLDDTRLHWVVNVGGRHAEWDAKILRQEPDLQISWISEDGRKTRGTVTFEPLGEGRTRVRLSLGYETEGFAEALGSAAGLDRHRIEGDLRRFKELVESRGAESGAWRGEIDGGSPAEPHRPPA